MAARDVDSDSLPADIQPKSVGYLAITVSVCLSVSFCLFVDLFLSACISRKPHIKISPYFLPARRYASAVLTVIVCLCVWPSVCSSV